MPNYTQSGYNPAENGYWKGTIENAINYGYPTNYYFADTMRSIFNAFKSYFDDLNVIRYNKFGEPVKTINVPVKFGPRNKSHDFRTEQESGETYYISLPNMVYTIESTEFDSDRAKGIYETRTFYNNDLEAAGLTCDLQELFWSDVQPVPYKINIKMDANCEKMSDANQIFEQIAVRFNPAAFMNIKEFWFFNKRRSIKMLLNSTSWSVESESMAEDAWRQIKLTFSFTLEVVLYKPIKSARIIEKINTFLTMNKGDYLWHNATFGNSNGSLENPYNFSKIYNTKVGNTYVLDGQPITTYDTAISAYTTIYNYKQTDELTTYDEDAKLLKKVITRWIPESNPVTGELVKVYDTNLDKIVSSAHIYSNEWYTLREYEYLSGYGNLKDQSVSFGSKTLYDQYGDRYSAYYSQYTEDGTYTNKFDEFSAGNYDYQYVLSAENGLHPKTIFNGGKY